jgi:hypothetical protein
MNVEWNNIRTFQDLIIKGENGEKKKQKDMKTVCYYLHINSLDARTPSFPKKRNKDSESVD